MISLQIDTTEAERKLLRIGRTLNARGLLKAIGQQQIAWIDRNFKQNGALAGGWRPLAENTVANRRRGSSNILQDTGKLKMSFVPEIHSDTELWVGSRLDVAAWQHYGTRPYEIRPVVAKALSFMTVHGRVFAKYVHHPGLPERRMLPAPDEAKQDAVRLLEAYVANIERKENL